MILEMDAQGVPEEEIIKMVMTVYGVDEVQANFIIGLERGTIQGDVIELQPGETAPEVEE